MKDKAIQIIHHIETIIKNDIDIYEFMNISITEFNSLPNIKQKLKQSYKENMIKYHPDKVQDTDTKDLFNFNQIIYKILTDNELLEIYNDLKDNFDTSKQFYDLKNQFIDTKSSIIQQVDNRTFAQKNTELDSKRFKPQETINPVILNEKVSKLIDDRKNQLNIEYDPSLVDKDKFNEEFNKLIFTEPSNIESSNDTQVANIECYNLVEDPYKNNNFDMVFSDLFENSESINTQQNLIDQFKLEKLNKHIDDNLTLEEKLKKYEEQTKILEDIVKKKKVTVSITE